MRARCPSFESFQNRKHLISSLAARRKLRRALEYLDRAKYEQTDPWIADDYAIAALTLRNLVEGIPNPWEYAFLAYFGKSYKKLIPIFLERERERLAMGPSLADPGEMERFLATATLPPKKPSQSVPGETTWKKRA